MVRLCLKLFVLGQLSVCSVKITSCIPDKNFPQITPVLANLISHTLIRPAGKINIENFYVFDIHWLYITSSRYAIVKVGVTERYDVTKRTVLSP